MNTTEASLSAKSRFSRFQEWVAPSESTKEATKRLDTDFRSCFPQDKYGEVSVTLSNKAFTTTFEQTLATGYTLKDSQLLSTMIADTLEKDGIENILVNRATTPQAEFVAKSKTAWENHRPESLERTESKLLQLLREIDGVKYSQVPDAYRAAYKDAILFQIQFCKYAKKVGEKEFTALQRSPKDWANLIDVVATQKNGEVTLRYEEQATQALERFSSNKGKEVESQTIESSFDLWNFSPSERNIIIADESVGEKLTPSQGKRLFEVLLKRVGIDWTVEMTSGSSAINVSSSSKKIQFPETRQLSGDDISYLAAHEFVHIIRGANGYKQECVLLSTGMEGYLPTEEGLAVMSEMIAGEPFGHDLQVRFAARYAAIAMAVKTETKDGKTVAKYSLQEIYNTLREYKLAHEDVAEIVWRISRGTSLQRQAVQIELPDSAGDVSIAETFVKDSVYFEGQMKLFEFITHLLPIDEKNIQEDGTITIHNKRIEDFSDRLLARVGQEVARILYAEIDPSTFQLPSKKDLYNAYSQLGKEVLLTILQRFMGGKMTFEAHLDSDWAAKVLLEAKDNIIQYRDLFESKRD